MFTDVLSPTVARSLEPGYSTQMVNFNRNVTTFTILQNNSAPEMFNPII